MADIFISYASEDRDFAARLASAFEAGGMSVWWDREIETGRRWRDVIEEELGQAGCVVVLWSRHSVESDWVLAESGQARASGTLVPVSIDGSAAPLEYRQIQTAPLRGWRGDPSAPEFVDLSGDVAVLLGRGAARKRRRRSRPKGSRGAVWRWAAAAVAVMALLVVGWLVWRRGGEASDGTGGDAAVLARLRADRSEAGRVLFLVPYDAATDELKQQVGGINEVLANQVLLSVAPGLQSLEGVEVDLDKFGVRDFPIELKMGDTERVGRFGEVLNALAVIGGSVYDRSPGPEVAVDTAYQIIPSVEGVSFGLIPIPNAYPDGQLSRMLSDLPEKWTMSTAVALGIREYLDARRGDPADHGGLRRARGLLKAAMEMAGEEDPLVPKIRQLMARIDQELPS